LRGRRRDWALETRPTESRHVWRTLAWQISIAATVIIPLLIDWQGADSFRLPKQAAFDGFSIAVLAVIAIAAILGKVTRQDAPAFGWYYIALASWTIVTVVAASQQVLAMHAVLSIFGGMAITAVVSLEKDRPLRSVFALLIPASLNGILYVLQELRIWNPFIRLDEFIAQTAGIGRDWRKEIHAMSTALLGNPSDVAGFFLPVVLAVAALAVTDRRRRPIFLALAVLVAGLVVNTRSLTTVFAMIAALFVLATLISRKAFVAAVTVSLCGAALLLFYGPLRSKLRDAAEDWKAQRYGRLFTSRLPAFAAAWEMIADHPVAGVGPGCFKFDYFDYKLRAETRHPWMLDSEARQGNFAEVHNDHLQVSAEMGIPGYFLFLAGLALLGSCSFKRRPNDALRDARAEFSRLCSLPLAVSFAVLAIGQFPLELPAVLIGFLYLAGLNIAWSDPR